MFNQFIEDIKIKIRSGNIITLLILINASVFLVISLLRILVFISGNASFLVVLNNLFIDNLSLPLSVIGFIHKPWTILTYMFFHIELMHLFWNMITLYWFGQLLSEFSSPKKIIPLYLLGGFAGAILTILLINYLPIFEIYRGMPLLGASAGVTAIIIASATLVPNYKLNLLFIGPVKLVYVALAVVFIDVLSVASYSNIGGNIAHIGGAIMGYVFIAQYKKGNDLSTGINKLLTWIATIVSKNKTAKMKVAHKRTVSDEEYNYNKRMAQEKIDGILDKISKSGYDSLSKSEKDFLFKESSKK